MITIAIECKRCRETNCYAEREPKKMCPNCQREVAEKDVKGKHMEAPSMVAALERMKTEMPLPPPKDRPNINLASGYINLRTGKIGGSGLTLSDILRMAVEAQKKQQSDGL